MAEMNIIDVATSAMRAVNNALMNMTGIALTGMPRVRVVEVISLRIFVPGDTFTSIVTFSTEESDSGKKGGVVLYIPRSNIENLFESVGLNAQSTDIEMQDACGELCNIMAGGFKSELVRLGYKDVHMSAPKKFAGDVNEVIEGISVDHKYELSFEHQKRGLLSLDVFVEG